MIFYNKIPQSLHSKIVKHDKKVREDKIAYILTLGNGDIYEFNSKIKTITREEALIKLKDKNIKFNEDCSDKHLISLLEKNVDFGFKLKL